MSLHDQVFVEQSFRRSDAAREPFRLDENLVMQAHDIGLTVTPYTFRSSNTGRFRTVREEMSYYLFSLGVGALFTDNPDLFPRAPINE